MIRRPPRSTLFPTRRSSDLDTTSGHGSGAFEPDPRTVRVAASPGVAHGPDRKSTRLNSSHVSISYAVFCLKKKKKINDSDGLPHGIAHTTSAMSVPFLTKID